MIGNWFRKKAKIGNLVHVYYSGAQASISVVFAHERKKERTGHLLIWVDGQAYMREFDFEEFKRHAQRIADDIGADIEYEVTVENMMVK